MHTSRSHQRNFPVQQGLILKYLSTAIKYAIIIYHAVADLLLPFLSSQYCEVRQGSGLSLVELLGDAL